MKLPLDADGDKHMKYFLYRKSNKSDDGFEILAENDKNGDPIIMQEYGIHNGIKLFVGAIVLPSVPAEIQLDGKEEQTPTEEQVHEENDDEEIFEI